MSNGWAAEQIGIDGKIVAGVVTAFPVTRESRVSAGGALNGIVKLSVSGVAQTGTITPKVQTANGSDWVDVKSGSSITADGIQYIRWNIEVTGDQAVLPLLNRIRVVMTTTNSSDSVTIDYCEFLQEL